MKKLMFIALISVLLNPGNTSGQSQEKAYALLLMNFAKNIQWPSNPGNSFTIGVIGYPPLISEMQTLVQTRSVAGKQIVLKEIDNTSDAAGCQILFIPSFKSKKLPDFLKSVGNSATLIVTNSIQFNQGSGVNLGLKDGKLIYQISSRNIEARGLKVPLSIKNMGTEVD